jgi:ureidoglycolate hydrolase
MYGKNEVTTHNYNESLSYDRNGNIIYLSRYGINDFGDPIPIDDLQYTYANNGMSNRLLSVSDSNFGNAAQGFKDGTNSGDDYAYDNFGNMTSINLFYSTHSLQEVTPIWNLDIESFDVCSFINLSNTTANFDCFLFFKFFLSLKPRL